MDRRIIVLAEIYIVGQHCPIPGLQEGKNNELLLYQQIFRQY